MTTKIINWVFIAVIAVMGLYLLGLGGVLIYFGGSVYYAASGAALLYVTYLIIKGKPHALHSYGVLLTVTLLWAVYEAELTFLALLPRLAMWMVLGLWFLSPFCKARLGTSENEAFASSVMWVVAPIAASALVLSVAAMQTHEVVAASASTRGPIEAAEDWPQYGNTVGGTRFSPLDDITPENISDLKELWRFRTGVENDFKMTPIQVDDLLYICGASNIVIAVDAGSGKEVWRHDPEVVNPAKHQYARTCRGLSYVDLRAVGSEARQSAPGHCETRIAMGTVDARLIALDARSGERCEEFGEGGAVDVTPGLGEHLPDEYYLTSPPLVADDKLVIGGLVLDSQDLGLPSGVVRAFDARSGELEWAWDLGRPQERGMPADSERYTPGTPNVWTVMSYDPELDLIFAPTGNAAPDYFGGARREFDDEWSSSLVALDASTGDPRWRYQTVHHDIWDYDIPAQPVLLDVEMDGTRVPAVVVATKTGELFMLDRRTGEPLHPVEERPVPQDPAPGEYLSETQPFSSLPHFHPFLHEEDMWGLTPLDQLMCRVEYKMLRYEGLFTPPMPKGSLQFPANFGGFNWGSVSVDADNGLLVAAPMLLANRTMLVTPEQVAEAGERATLLLGQNHPAVHKSADDPMPLMGEPDPDDPFDHRRIKYYGLTLPFMSRFTLPLLGNTQVPCFEPPWSRLAVIDLKSGELLWSRPIGSMKLSGPFGWRSGLPFQVGTPVRAGTLTTRGGVTFMSSTMDSTVRAFDLRDGSVLWSEDLPGSGQATPMSYRDPATGQQIVIVTVPNPSWRYPRDPSTGTYTDSKSAKDGKGGYVIAYALAEE